jgi:DNA polymerase-3 subunit delta'
VIAVPGQPLAERVLRAALARDAPPQQLLLFGPAGTGKRAAATEVAWALMDPAGAHPRAAALDLTRVAATGHQILLADLEAGLQQVASRPSVMARRVLILEGAERLSERDGAPRMLKMLEEPPPRTHFVLVTDHPADLLPTVRSRCLPVPFRRLGAHVEAAALSPFDRELRRIGVRLALAALSGEGSPAATVRAIQAQMEEVAAGNRSPELVALEAEAEAIRQSGRTRGLRTAEKRVEDQQKRERRRMVSDGWATVLDAAAATAGDALAVAVGAEAAVRSPEHLDALREVGRPERQAFLERAIAEIAQTRAELELNPSGDLAAEALLVRIDDARHGAHGRLIRPGRLGV